ncbi:TlpA family protein disulfide reductase [Winogradskyella sp. PC D3.3]
MINHLKKAFLCNKPIGLLLFMSFTLLTCKKEIKKLQIKANEENQKLSDSIKFSINFTDKGYAFLSVPDRFLYSYPLTFNDKKTSHTISRDFDSFIVSYSVSIPSENGKREFVQQNYLISDDSIINLKYNSRTYRFENHKLNIDSINNTYSAIKKKILTSKKKKIFYKNELDTLYTYYRNKFNDRKEFLKYNLNELYYYDRLQLIDSLNDKVDGFLKNELNTNNFIASSILYDFLNRYIEYRITTIDFDKIDSLNYSKSYVEFVSLGVFAFLRNEENKGYNKFLNAKNWLRGTKMYAENKEAIEKEIEPLDNENFKKKLAELNFSDTKNKQLSFSQITKQSPTQYFLIDFWATWCAPCIQGVKTMNKMGLPKNIKVISISVDKEKDKQKWKTKTKELEQSLSYWIDETDSDTKEFMKFIEMKSIPRYILIDKDMNLIDQAFYHPQEPQFLSKLQNIKNHKYW